MTRALWLLFVSGCVSNELAPVRLELLVRGSCPASTAAYDISCVQALTVALVGADERRFRSECMVLAGKYASLVDLIASREVSTVLERIRARSNVRLELHAYKGADGAPCSALDDKDLMFWGSSDFVDLSSEALAVVSVPLECRPECDCADLDSDPVRCPANLPVGACGPAPDRLCRRPCNEGAPDQCYGGVVPCQQNVCDADLAAFCCGSTDRGMCFKCASDSDCDSALCVRNTQTGELFCAARCPPLPWSYPCPDLMNCKRLGGPLQCAGTCP